MSGADELALAELLCARLCHDLSGPVSAVATGAELLEEEAENGLAAGGSEALELMATSAVAAVARLRFLRQAFGPGGAPVASAQLRKLADDFLASPGGGEQAPLSWSDGAKEPWDPQAARLLLNVILLGRDSLPRGGSLTLRCRHQGESLIQLIAAGTSAAPAEAAKALEAGQATGLGARGAQGYLAACLAARLGLALEVTAAPGQVMLTVGKG